jgi:8-amino-7-oxononanoate synthase
VSSLIEHLNKSLTTIKKAHWYRQEKTITSLSGSTIELEGKSMVNFASNDYLGLAGDERLIEAAIAATQKYGTGSTGSRLLSGHRDLHHQLESAIAALKQTEKALVFSSGYLANLGTISALVGKKDLILGDEYNHSSLKNGAKLSQAEIKDYQHCDCQDLIAQLTQYRSQYRHCLITSDSVFSMDGDLCPLPALIDIAEKFDCWLLLDEAHGTGVLGKNGAGCVEHFAVKNDNLIQIGTLSKAVGSLGGYVTGNKVLIDFLRNRCATWIYTTALSPADTASALKAIEIIQSDSSLRHQLWTNINLLKNRCTEANLKFLPSQSAIVCLPVTDAPSALKIATELSLNGFFAPAIRPPTVPTSRIRFSLMATHQSESIEKLVEVITQKIKTLNTEH